MAGSTSKRLLTPYPSSRWPVIATIWFCELSLNTPLRVKERAPLSPASTKKPSPWIARSVGLDVTWIVP